MLCLCRFFLLFYLLISVIPFIHLPKPTDTLSHISFIQKKRSYDTSKTTLLDPLFIQYAMEIKKIVNPFDLYTRGIYGGAGTDLVFYLLATNAQNSYFISFYYQLRADDLKKHSLKDYFEQRAELYYRYLHNKRQLGFSSVDLLGQKDHILCGLATELHMLGVDLSKVKIDSVDKEHGFLKITFPWIYPGTHQTKKYSITFFDADTTVPNSYPHSLRRKIRYGFDLYFQRAGMGIGLQYDCFVPTLFKHLIPGGYFITDQVAHDGSLNQFVDVPFSNPEQPYHAALRLISVNSNGAIFDLVRRQIRTFNIMYSVSLAKNGLSSFEEKDPQVHYGWNLAIRQKQSSQVQFEQAI